MMEYWKNIWHTIMLQKWRSLMTAFGVFWGILMLVILMGVGKGILQGSVGRMAGITPLIEFESHPTTKAYHGFSRDRQWMFDDKGADMLLSKFPGQVKAVGKALFLYEQLLSYGQKAGTYQVTGMTPEFMYNYPQRIICGRHINRTDVQEKRKVCVLGEDVWREINGSDDYASAIGQTIKIAGINYTVVGITHCTNKMYSQTYNPSINVYMPLTTAQMDFGKGSKYQDMTAIIADGVSAIEVQPAVDAFVRDYYDIHPQDIEALEPYNTEKFSEEKKTALVGVTIFLWLIGIGTLVAGLIGITNIMLVSIKERTQEIGVYRAMGAQPGVIIRMILSESLLLTLSAGISGMALGIYLLAAIRSALAQEASDDDFISNPYVPVAIALSALLILVLGGLVSGYVPIRKALKIKAIEALRG